MNRIRTLVFLLIALGVPVLSAGEGAREDFLEPDRLPVTDVTLYTAGLAWMVHEAEVTDDEVLYFSVDQSDINDILKSLVVEDLGGGTVDSINFDSENPLTVALSDLRVNPSGSPPLIDFLLRTQGEQVSVVTTEGTFEGRIFSIEDQIFDNSHRFLLNLMDLSGLISVDITDLEFLKFSDSVLQKELVAALDLISRSRVKSSRLLKLSFKGNGTRKIRLSYIRSVPLWKTSYRITLDEQGIPRLEGWALVQNTGILDWEDVRLSFVAGQPNAFIMDLATPRYVYREEVQTASAAPIGPTEYERAYAMMDDSSYKSSAPSRAYSESSILMEEDSYEPEPIRSQATGTQSGNFYRYTVNHKVTVDGRSSAMIPIILEGAVGDSLAVYDPSYNLVFKGIRLQNETEAHWAAGPATIAEGRFYGGDALLPEMTPGAVRLISYAVHGSLTVDKIVENEAQRIESLKMVDGLLYRTDKIVRASEYRIEGEEKELLLIHPKEWGWNLVDNPEIAEESEGEYRFSLNDWEKPLVISEEYIVSQEISLNGLRLSEINYYKQWGEISREMKNAFEEISALLQHIESIHSEISTMNSRVSRLERDQNRVRENMKVLDRDSDLYRQYSNQLSEQESEIQQLNKDITDRQNNVISADESLREYIRGLDIN